MDQTYSENTDPTGGFSNETLLLVSLIGLTITFIALLFLCQRAPQHIDDDEDEITYEQALQEADVGNLTRAQRRARARLLMKKNRRLPTTDAMTQPQREGQLVLQDPDDAEGAARLGVVANNNAVNTGTKLSRKERQKAAKELERIERKANEEQRRLMKQHEEEERKIREMLRKEKEAQAELEKKEKLEKQFRAWKYMFPESDLETRVTVKEFVEELEMNPIISLEETAEEFGVSVTDFTERCNQLKSEGRMCHGIVNIEKDEFVYVSEASMVKIASFIKKEGRVNLSDLSEEVHRIVRAEMTHSDEDEETESCSPTDKKNQ